jgi:hypothetical protein
MHLAGVIEEFVEEVGWKDEVERIEEEGTSRLAVRLTVSNQSYRLFIEGYEARQWVALFLYPPFGVIDGKFLDACMLFNFINDSYSYTGRITVHDDGTIRYRQIVDVGNVVPTAGMIRDMLRCAVNLFETNADSITSVALTGKSYESIRAEIERKALMRGAREEDSGV